jgi:hydrogenase maturation protease
VVDPAASLAINVSLNAPPSAVLIIGYGNPLRGDDGLGLAAAAALTQLLADRPDVQVITVHQLTPDLAELIAGYATVIMLDAHAGETPGELVVTRIAPVAGRSQPFSHYLSPAELLTVTEALYDRRPAVWLAGLTGSSFEVGHSLSEPVRQALPGLVSRVLDLVAAAQA